VCVCACVRVCFSFKSVNLINVNPFSHISSKVISESVFLLRFLIMLCRWTLGGISSEGGAKA